MQAVNYISMAQKDSTYNTEAEVIGNMVKAQMGTEYFTHSGQKWMISYMPLAGPEGWSIVLMVPVSQIMQSYDSTLLVCIILALLILVISFFDSNITSAKFVRPVREVADRIKLLSTGDLTTEVNTSVKSTEMINLTDSLVIMVNSLRSYIFDISRVLSAMADKRLHESE